MRPRLFLLALALASAALRAPAAELKLSLVARTGDQLILRAELIPDLASLAPGDFELALRSASAPPDAPATTVPFICTRLRGAYYFDVREFPPVPRDRYLLTLAAAPGGRPVARAQLDRPIEYAPPEIDVALVIDQSFSMQRTDPDRLRVAAAKLFVDLAAATTRIRSLCVVVFDAQNDTLIPLTRPSERKKFHDAIDRIGTLGQTNIDGALARAARELSLGTSRGKAAVLLTDGQSQPNPYADAHKSFAAAAWPIYTIGLSKEADAPTLLRIAKDTGGTFYDAPTNDKLREIFARICFALERQSLVRKQVLNLNPGESRTDPVLIDDTVSSAVFSVRSPRADLAFSVQPPPGAAAEPERSNGSGPFRFHAYRRPAVGTWSFALRNGQQPAALELETAAATTLFPVLFPLADEFKYGEPVDIACSLADGPRPVTGARVEARLVAADGKTFFVPLADATGGVYAATVASRIEPGDFTLTISVRGTTARGSPFERAIEATGRVAAPREPEIWASASTLDLGSIYNTETARAALNVRKILPPGAALDLAASCSAPGLPADAFAVELAKPGDDGLQELSLSFTAPVRQPAGKHTARLLLALGPKTSREITVRLEILNPRIVIEPQELDFGPVLLGSRVERRIALRVEPRGAADVSLALTGDLLQKLAAVAPASARVGTRDASLALTVAPAKTMAVGPCSGSLRLDAGFASRQVPVSLTLARTTLLADPAAVDFGDLEPGAAAAAHLRLRVSGTAPVVAAVRAELAGLPPSALSLHDASVSLRPDQATELELKLTTPPAQRPGPISGLLRFRTDDDIGTVQVRARIIPAPTFLLEPPALAFGAIDIGRRSTRQLTLRSTIDIEQDIRIRPAASNPLIRPQSEIVKLPPRRTALVVFDCLPPLQTVPGAVREDFTLLGPMLPRPLTVTADLVRPAAGTFILKSDLVPLGRCRTGSELRGAVSVTSALDLPQEIVLVPESSIEQSVWPTVPQPKTLLPPRAAADIPVRCSVSPGASEGTASAHIAVVGPFERRRVTLGVDVCPPPIGPSASSRYLVLLLLLFGILITAAVAFLLVRALLRIPSHRMARYFAASAVINVGFFVTLTQMLAVKKVIEGTPFILVRVEEPTEAVTAAAEPTPTDRPIDLKDREQRADAARLKTNPSDPARAAADAEQARLEAQKREQERLRAELETSIEKQRLELAKLSSPQLEQVISSAEEIKRKLEQPTDKPIDPAAVDEHRSSVDDDRAKQLETALELARLARELAAERARSAPPGTTLDAPHSRESKITPQLLDVLLADVSEARRKTESATPPAIRTAPVGDHRAGGTQGSETRVTASADFAAATAREAPAPRAPAELPSAPPGGSWRGATAKTDTPTAEPVAAEASPAPRKDQASAVAAGIAAGIAAVAEAGLGLAPAAAPVTGVAKVTATPGATPASLVPATDTATSRGAAPSIEPGGMAAPTPGARLTAIAAASEPVTSEARQPEQAQLSGSPRPDRISATPADPARAAGAAGTAARGEARAESAHALTPAEPGALKLSAGPTAAGPTPTVSFSHKHEAGAPAHGAPLAETAPTARKTEPAASAAPADATLAAPPAAPPAGSVAGAAVRPGPPNPTPAAPSAMQAGAQKMAPLSTPSLAAGPAPAHAPRGAAAITAAESIQPEAAGISPKNLLAPQAGLADADTAAARAGPAAPAAKSAALPAAGEHVTPGAEIQIVKPTGTALALAPVATPAAAPVRIASAAPVESAIGTLAEPLDRRTSRAPQVALAPAQVAQPERAAAAAIAPDRSHGAALAPAAPAANAHVASPTRQPASAPGPELLVAGLGTAFYARIAARPDEPLNAATVLAAPARTEATPLAELAAGTASDGPAAAAPAGASKAPTDLPAPPASAAANLTGAVKNPDPRVGRGELLLASAMPLTKQAHTPAALADSGVAVRTPVARSTQPAPAERDASLAQPFHIEREPGEAARLASIRHEVAPALTEPLRTLSPPTARAPVTTLAPGPVSVPATRTAAAELAARRAAGTVPFALARYGGDWDCDATAMPNLAYQLERRAGILLGTEPRTLSLTDPNLASQPFIFISGHKDFRLTDPELAALQRYVKAGGCIWINDSTDELDLTFDRAVRRELKRLLPASDLVRLPPNHPVFSSCYDLTKGFRGYAVPPGDKYRCDYLEGVSLEGRTAVVYTRNDYGDGLEIDPNTAPLMPSLTDLSPQDMQESSTRMGINIVLHFLHGRPGSLNVDRVAEAVRAETARAEHEARSALESAQIALLDNFDAEFSWKLEPDWGDPADVAAVPSPANKTDIRMALRFQLADKRKVAAGRDLLEEKDFSKHNALLVDFTSRLSSGCRVALGLVTMPDWKYFESTPAYVRPGANPNVVFRLDLPNFKTADGGWKYNQRVANLAAVRKVVILVYPISGGSVEVDNLRLGKLPLATPPATK